MIRQVSVFMENQAGQLGKVLRVLARAEVNIRSLTIAETLDYGILRLILQDTDAGLASLKRAGILANVTRVLAAEVPDSPGGMSAIVDVLAEAGIGIAYAYSFLPKNTKNAVIVLKVMDADNDAAAKVLTEAPGIILLERDELLDR